MNAASEPIEDAPPAADHLTDYDRAHLKTYLRLLDAAADEADWREVAAIVLGLDPASEPDRARRVHAAHLERAKWMTRVGYRDLLSVKRTH
jgi:hypothetical protein